MADAQPISLNKKLQGKIAIVTGGASGIGEATARLFAANGARVVVIADVQDEKGRSVMESIGPHRCSYFHCDVTDETQVKSMVDWTAATHGGLDVVFSNAGIVNSPVESILDLDFSVYDGVMAVNARGMALCVKHAARKMVELGSRGVIVCTASAVVEVGAPTNVDYAMSKHAVVGLMRSTFQKLGEHGIRINCISPSMVPTPLAMKLGFTGSDAVGKALGPITSLKGVELTVEQVAEAVAFLVSDQAAFVTGQNLVIDGGINLHSLSQHVMMNLGK